MNILITGGCGFIGSSLALKIKEKHSDWNVMAFDNLKRRGSEMNLQRFRHSGIEFIHGDVRNTEDFSAIREVNLIIDASAEPSVSAGLEGDPSQVIAINLIGTINILSRALKWGAKLIFLSTSRVYSIQSLVELPLFEGNTRFNLKEFQDRNGLTVKGLNERFDVAGPRSIYGTTKLASELLIGEYNEFLGLQSIINRCGVVAGPGQLGKVDQGFLVLWVARHYWKRTLSYFGYGGSGKQVRDVLHIEDLFDLIYDQIMRFDVYNGSTFNVGGGLFSSVSLLELTAICEEIVGNKIEIKSVDENRVADIPWYVSDTSLVEKIGNWNVHRKPSEIVHDVYLWIRQNEVRLKRILDA